MSTNTNTSYDEADLIDSEMMPHQTLMNEIIKPKHQFSLILKLPSQIVVMEVFSFFGSEDSVMKVLRQLSQKTRQYIYENKLALPQREKKMDKANYKTLVFGSNTDWDSDSIEERVQAEQENNGTLCSIQFKNQLNDGLLAAI